jgi:N-methylhydantoinase A
VLAREPIEQKLAQPLSLPLAQTAASIIRISEAKIIGASREISVERGFHPRDFTLFAFGGGGGFVAARVARELGVPRAIVPLDPANFSALGMLMVDVVHDFAQTYVTELAQADVETLNSLYRNLATQGQDALTHDGFAPKDRLFIRSAELRYQGQEHTVDIPLPDHNLSSNDLIHIIAAFNDDHSCRGCSHCRRARRTRYRDRKNLTTESVFQ